MNSPSEALDAITFHLKFFHLRPCVVTNKVEKTSRGNYASAVRQDQINYLLKTPAALLSCFAEKLSIKKSLKQQKWRRKKSERKPFKNEFYCV
jgi:hypothetical protein